MPFITESNPGGFVGIPQADLAKIATADEPTTGEVFRAAFRQENTLVSAAASGFGGDKPAPVRGHNPYDNDNIKGYEDYAHEFLESKSPLEDMMIKNNIDLQQRDRETLAAGGTKGVAAMVAAGITDPIYLPLMLIGVGEARVAASTLRGAARAATFGAGAEVLAETAKHATQETRTAEESAWAIGGSVILSGLLGGAATKMAATKQNKIARQIDDVLAAGEDIPIDKSMGAAQVSKQTAEELELVGVGGVETLGLSPQIRMQNSPSVETMRIASNLMESSLVTKGNKMGIATAPVGGAAETRIKKWDGGLYQAIDDLNNTYLKYRKSTSGIATSAKDLLGGRGESLSPEQFRSEVGRAMRRDDKHVIPEVAEAAANFRKNVFDPLKDAAIEGRLLPEGVKTATAASYLTRVYRTDKIIADTKGFDAIVTKWLRGQRESSIRSVAKRLEAGKKIPDSQKGSAGITDLEIEEIAAVVREKITGASAGRIPYDAKIAERGPMKDRTFNIPDHLIEEFLESDIDTIARQYTSTMAPDVELNRMFGELNGEQIAEEISNSYGPLIKNAKTKKEATRLDDRMRADKRDAQAVWDRLRGTYKTPDDPKSFFVRAGRFLRDFNFVTKLGSMTLSAIPDVASIIMVNGMRPFARGLIALAKSPKEYGASVETAKKWGVGWDMVSNSRAASMAELQDAGTRASRFEQGSRKVVDTFSKATLMSQWNQTLKQFAGVLTQDRLLGNVVKLSQGKLGKSATARMANAGISGEMAERIAQQFAKYGDEGSLRLSSGGKWDDVEALDTFSSAVLKDVDRAVATPGVGEKPLWTSSETGKMIFQFKTFAAVAHHKVFLTGLQHRDMQALNGLIMMTAMGHMAGSAKNFVAGREVSKDPEKQMVEAFDRSGATGYLFDANNILEKMTRGKVGINPMIGQDQMSRYASRNLMSSLMGPSFGMLGDATMLIGAISEGEFTKGDARKVRQMIPFQNLFYIRQLLDKLQDKATEGL